MIYSIRPTSLLKNQARIINYLTSRHIGTKLPKRRFGFPPTFHSFMLPKSRPQPTRMLTEIFLLVLMMWPAPIPVGHRHCDYSSRVSGMQMARHLQCCHGGFSNSGNWPNDWHWHWVYPTNPCGQLDFDEAQGRADQMVTGRPVDTFVSPRICLLDGLASSVRPVRPLIPLPRRYAFQTVALLHSRQSLPELLGVVRC